MKIWALCLCQLLATSAACGADNIGPAEQALRAALFTRTDRGGETYGREQLDLLFWSNTRYLITEPSHMQAMSALDRFIAAHGEKTLREPWRRALLQRDLWQLFDWTHREHLDAPLDAQWGDLQSRLATVIRRLALNDKQIGALPHNLDLSADGAAVPRGLLDAHGDWLLVGSAARRSAVPIHQKSFGFRSVFLVLVKFPEGRAQGEEWLHDLQGLSSGATTSDARRRNFSAPFPAGTAWALVRLMTTIDQRGEIRATHFVESLQLRRYGVAPAAAFEPQEFDLDRLHAPRLRALGEDEYDFEDAQFFSSGRDPIEQSGNGHWQSPSMLQRRPLDTCARCHAGRALYSVNSFQGFTRFDDPANVESTLELEAAGAAYRKTLQPDWQELSRLWKDAR